MFSSVFLRFLYRARYGVVRCLQAILRYLQNSTAPNPNHPATWGDLVFCFSN